MKKFNEKTMAVVSRLCVAVLALLGFSCSNYEELMYGTPTGSFEVKGTVTDEDNRPVADAKVIMPRYLDAVNDYPYATTLSNKDGNYSMSGTIFHYVDSLSLVCIPKDTSLIPDTITVAVAFEHDKKHDKEHKDAFEYFGHTSITADFKLKKKQ